MTVLLQATDIGKSFAGVEALSDVSISVDEGQRVGLIGPNGAGKTTFFNCLFGMIEPDRGEILLSGRDLSGLAPHRRARLGLGRTFQRMELFSDMTVLEHLLVAERVRGHRGGLWQDLTGRGRPRRSEVDPCEEVLELLGLGELATVPIETLSLGQGRLVEVGRALMADPRLLLLDEPSSGLDQLETRMLADTLRAVQRERGFAILLVEHDVELVASFTEQAVVLDFGRMIASGPTRDVLADPDVRLAYLGDIDHLETS